MRTKLPYIIMAFLLCFAGNAAFGQGKTQSGNGTYTPSNDNYGSVQVNYEYAFNGTQMKIKITQVVIEFSVAMARNEPELHNELRKRGILPLTQQSGAGVTINYEGQIWFLKGYDSHFPISGSVSGTMTDYAFFEPDEALKKRSREHYEKYKTNYYNDYASLFTFTITDVQYPDLDRKIDAVRREIAAEKAKAKQKEKEQKEAEEKAKKEQAEKEQAEKEKQAAEAKEKAAASGNTASSGGSDKKEEKSGNKKDSDKEETGSGKKSSKAVYIPKSNRQLYNELKAMTDAHPEMLNDPKIRTRLRGYKALADRDDRNIRDYNTLEQTMGGGYNPNKITAMNSIYQTNANIANAEMAVDAGVDAATNVVNSIVEANNRKEEQKLADYQRRASSNENKVEAIKHWEYQLLEQRRAYEKDIKSQIKADFNLIATIDDMPITYESENYIEKGLWDGHFEKATKKMDKTYNLYIVELDGLYGISGDNGEALYPPQFEGIYALNLKNEDKRPRFLVNIKDKWGEILADGSIAEAIKYDGIWYAPDKKSKILKQGDSWQVKSLDKNSLLKQFTSTQLPGIYAGGLIAVINTNNKGFDQKSGNYSLADDGNVYVWGKSTEKGVASIMYESAKKGEVTERLFKINNKWFITSNFGTKDMKIEPMPATFVIPVLREKKWGAINQEGKTVIPFEHSYIKSSGNQFETDRETYRADGTLVSKKETETELKNATKEYYDNGNLKTIGAFDLNKKATGIWKFYRKNGTLKSVANYKNGEAYLWEFYAEDGKSLEARIPTPEGTATLFHKSGRKKGTGLMIDGKEEGRWQKYYDNEQSSILCEGEYLHGKQIALWKFYFENGKIMAEGRFIDGLEVGEWKYYHSNGKLKEVGKYKNGEKTGKWHQYDENGNEI